MNKIKSNEYINNRGAFQIKIKSFLDFMCNDEQKLHYSVSELDKHVFFIFGNTFSVDKNTQAFSCCALKRC